MLWLEPGIVAATDAGIVAMPAATNSRPSSLGKPDSVGAGACSLTAVSATVCIAAWQHAVQVLRVSTAATGASHGGARTQFAGGGGGHVQAHVLHTFHTSDSVLGAAPFGSALLLLVGRSNDTDAPAALPSADSNVKEHAAAQNDERANVGTATSAHAITKQIASSDSVAAGAHDQLDEGGENGHTSAPPVLTGDGEAHSNGAQNGALVAASDAAEAASSSRRDVPCRNGATSHATSSGTVAQTCLQVVSTSGHTMQQIQLNDPSPGMPDGLLAHIALALAPCPHPMFDRYTQNCVGHAASIQETLPA